MFPRGFLFLLIAGAVLTTPVRGWAVEESDCQAQYSQDDPSLFNFVETRAAVNYGVLAGRPIRDIQFAVLPIFNLDDPEENIWPYRLLNRLHIRTRDKTLRKQMIISPGDALDVARLEENERLLRDNSYLVDAMILPRAVCDDGVSLLVVVRDVWTLVPSASASRSGGETTTGAGISDKNLLGTGQTLSLGYFEDSERNGLGLSYRNQQLFNSHSVFKFDYFDTSDGDLLQVGLTKPFYELDTRWYGDVNFFDERLTDEIEVDDVVINEYQRETRSHTVAIGWSPGLKAQRVHRFRLGWTEEDTVYSPVADAPSFPPEDRLLRYPWLGWEFLEDRYWTASNITRSNRQEDIPLGTDILLELGYASRQAGSSRETIVGLLEASHTASVGDHHLFRLSFHGDGRYDVHDDTPDGLLYGVEAQYYFFLDRLNRWYTRVRYDGGRNLAIDEQLTSGGGDNLRGYPSDIQRGNRRWIFTVERRRFTNIHLLNLAWLGGAAYIDVGRTRDTENPPITDNDPVLSNLGLGLRLSPSKFRVDRVLHLDIAFPMAERDRVDDYQIILAGRIEF